MKKEFLDYMYADFYACGTKLQSMKEALEECTNDAVHKSSLQGGIAQLQHRWQKISDTIEEYVKLHQP